jgi:hypothetical protein
MVPSNENVTEGMMCKEDRMTIDERYKYLRKMQKRYREGGRLERQELLDEMETVTGLHRKSLTRLMNGYILRKPREKQRGCKYGLEVDQVLGVIAQSMDYPCAERLQPNLSWMAEQLAYHGEMEVPARVSEQLEQISISTVQRRLKYISAKRQCPRRRPEQTNRLRREVPAGRIAWDEQEVGHFEVDLVHHCGSNSSGQYVHTLQMIDVATGWSERVAVLGRSYLVMQDGFERILARLPFRVREIHPDNGSEFFNDHLMRFWYGEITGLRLSRSRPWHKNDNRFVEQKNDTLVRGYLGYKRLDTVEHTNLLNQLFDLMWLYHNFFQPVMRLREKTPIFSNDKLLRFKRRFDRARTPFERLCDVSILDLDTVASLRELRLHTNPLALRQQIYDLLHKLLTLPEAPADPIQDVHLTLGLWKLDQNKSFCYQFSRKESILQ